MNRDHRSAMRISDCVSSPFPTLFSGIVFFFPSLLHVFISFHAEVGDEGRVAHGGFVVMRSMEGAQWTEARCWFGALRVATPIEDNEKNDSRDRVRNIVRDESKGIDRRRRACDFEQDESNCPRHADVPYGLKPMRGFEKPRSEQCFKADQGICLQNEIHAHEDDSRKDEVPVVAKRVLDPLPVRIK